MSWFERHLNWTMILAFFASFLIVYLVSLFIISVFTYMSTGIYYFIIYTVNILWILFVGAWVLRKKMRSLWNLLLLFVPFGLIIFLCLENRTSNISGEFSSDNLREEVR